MRSASFAATSSPLLFRDLLLVQCDHYGDSYLIALGDTEAALRGLERSLADRLHSVAIHVLRHARTADTAVGMSAARLSVLSVLVFGGSTDGIVSN